MAFSQPLTSSIRKGQTALVCELCENDPKLKWKCLDCKLMMCQRCRDKVHPKFPSAEHHTIIDIKDISKYQEEQKLDITKLKCSEHAGQNCCLFCKQCDKLVCPLCIAKTHKKHDLIEINEGYQIKVEKISNDQKHIRKELKTLSREQEELRKIKFLEKSSYQKSEQGIQEYKKSLAEAVEKHCDELSQELNQKWSVFSTSLTEEENRAKDIEEKLCEKSNELKDAVQSNDARMVFSTKSVESISKEQVRLKFNHIPKFVPGDISKVSVLHGSLEEVNDPLNTELKVIQSFQTGCDGVVEVVACSDGSLWIHDNTSVRKLKPVRNTLEVKHNIDLEITNMAISPSGDILLCAQSSVLKVIPSGTEEVKDSIYNVSPLEAVCVHVTNNNKVIIGAVDENTKQVIVLDKSGRQERVFQYDHNNKPLFTAPARVVSNDSNNICVIDWPSEVGQERVVILDQEGEVRKVYTGHHEVNTEDNPFEPFSIKTTPSDNFVISDPKNHTLHILSSEGEVITYYNTEKLGIIYPVSLSFSQTGELYTGIGCGSFIYKIDNFVY